MKKTLVFLLAGVLIFSCKKEDDPEPEPEPEKRGTITVSVQTYDSLGSVLGDKSGVRVRLNTGQTATTTSNGEVKFDGFVHGDYVVDVFREGWDGPPALVKLDTDNKGVTLPMAQRSGFQTKNQTGQSYTKDSITISFSFNIPVPQGVTVRVAILTSTATPVNESTYSVSDVIEVQGGVTKYNIARLPALAAFVDQIEENTTFYVSAWPVSYGKFQSNALPKPVILGENLMQDGSITLLKNWF
jgi:hypothetical protein